MYVLRYKDKKKTYPSILAQQLLVASQQEKDFFLKRIEIYCF